ncbi:MAG: hypothetical protein KKH52_02320 [Nanoarchaeota archaeon]|nr:hypothetical protein [Nanoarchaeota archaeon]MBU1623205.1 hypothetical protein [Nanoarchaeota archaeon]MBU1974207.1 hypothetical protein [Nanoarchaeota archaeon]
MVNLKELQARMKEHFRFSWQEHSGLIVGILIAGFIFSFRDWGGETFDLVVGVKNLFLVFIIAAVSFYFRIACQKIYALTEGYKAEFKIWWAGLVIMLIVGFVTLGRVPLIFIGGIVASFMVRQRLGEFRYGFSYGQNGLIALWGILGSMILAIVFAVGAYIFPQSYFFSKGLIFNIIMAVCALIPLPQLDGLNIFFGSRVTYVIAIFTVLLGAVLLLTGTKIGLILAIILSGGAGVTKLLIGSEK